MLISIKIYCRGQDIFLVYITLFLEKRQGGILKGLMVFSFYLHIVSSTGLNVSLTDTVFGKELESLVGIGDLLVTKSGDCANFAMQVQFMSLPGDLPEMMVRFDQWPCPSLSFG